MFYSPRGLAFLRDDASHWRRNVFRKLESLAGGFGGVLIGCSPSELAEIRRHLPGSRCVLVENAVDVAKIPRKREVSGELLRVGTVGRVSPQKDPGAFAALAHASKDPGVEFVWVGAT